MWQTGNCKFRYRYIEFFTDKLNRLVHIIDAEVFTHQAKIMFGSARNNDFTFLFISKPDRITDQVHA